ncbi:MAG: hypothetical protein NZ898_10515 [Myxococcota bacterium]|nr:hypothetical protein [Myxococcota bacterium]MDW8363407.1 hypothetical protein [Myxococcales bacterium]
MRRRVIRLVSRLVGIAALSSAGACTPQGDPAIGPSGFSDDFERTSLGDLYHNTGGPYEIRNGWLHVRGARNRPLWLRRRLPRDARIEMDVRSETPDGDIKVEAWGDGVSKAEAESYRATSYVIIFGGWNNSLNLIARMDEHGDDRAIGSRRRVEPGRVYRLVIERRGDTIEATVDGELLARMRDPDPLEGRGHEYFAFNNWQSDLWFDNLRITPL